MATFQARQDGSTYLTMGGGTRKAMSVNGTIATQFQMVLGTGATLSNGLISSTNVGVGASLMSIILPNGTFSCPGKLVRFFVSGVTTSNLNAKNFIITFGGTTILSSATGFLPPSMEGVFWCGGFVQRSTDTQFNFAVQITNREKAIAPSAVFTIAANEGAAIENPSSNLTLDFKMTQVAPVDIVIRAATIRLETEGSPE
jgi:hypothetical protein